MSDSLLTDAEIKSYRACIGRTITETDRIDPHVASRMAATLDRPHPGDVLPPLWHFGLFLTDVGTSGLGPDGHPPRGPFLPPVSLPRRMFAGSDLAFVKPLTIGMEVTRVSRIAAVDHRRGKTGDLVFVRVAMEFTQAGVLCLTEEQTIVYRGMGPPVPSVVAKPWAALPDGAATEEWQPSPVELFRYSAVTFNGHRIHYDLPYATGEEGYPGLVVHGPLTATRLCDFAGRLSRRPLRRFVFRGEAPLFCGAPVRLVGRIEGALCRVRAERADGVTGMSATADLG